MSWNEFKPGKRHKDDVQSFERRVEDNLFKLQGELSDRTYRHGDYTSFYITDPKLRHIHKAEVRDRIVHHAVYRILYPLFDDGFIFDSYSCRIGKGTHAAVDRLEHFIGKVTRNHKHPCFALKCDVKKFFDSVDHDILQTLIRKKISDPDVLWLIKEIINSFGAKHYIQLGLFEREREREFTVAGRGIPIGNLTSQLFANIYLNELDQFLKHGLKIKRYLRYCDDFVILGETEEELRKIIPLIDTFLKSKLKLKLHENKIHIRKLRQGIDFLGYIVLPYHRVLRTKTKKRLLKRANEKNFPSYLGLLGHCDAFELTQRVKSTSGLHLHSVTL